MKGRIFHFPFSIFYFLFLLFSIFYCLLKRTIQCSPFVFALRARYRLLRMLCFSSRSRSDTRLVSF